MSAVTNAGHGLARFRPAARRPLLLFGGLLGAAAVANVVAPGLPFWAIVGPVGLVVVAVLEWRAERRHGPRGRLVVALVAAAVLVAAVRVTAVLTGSIVAADTVLGVVLAAQGVVLRSRAMILGGVVCAVLAVAAGFVLDPGTALDVTVSLTSAAALLGAAAGIERDPKARTGTDR